MFEQRWSGRGTLPLHVGETLGKHAGFFDRSDVHTQTELMQFVKKFFSIDQFDGGCPISRGFSERLAAERARGYHQSAISTPDHRSPEISNDARPNASRVALALEQD